jgi:Trk-type K+ transport system membrane component
MPSNIVRAVRAESRFRNHNQLERLYLQLRLRWAFVLVLLFLGLTPLALWREYQWKTETELASSFFETFDAVESDAETEEITCLLASY